MYLYYSFFFFWVRGSVLGMIGLEVFIVRVLGETFLFLLLVF